MDNPYKTPEADLGIADLSDFSGGPLEAGAPAPQWTPAPGGHRWVAYFADSLLIFGSSFALVFVLSFLEELGSVSVLELVPEQLLGMVFMVPAVFVFGTMEGSSWQGSPGKKLMGLRVVGLHGDDIDLETALKRNAIKWMGLSFCGLLAFTAMGGTGSSVWDRAAGTRVVKRRGGTGRASAR